MTPGAMRFVTAAEDDGTRLDRFVAEHMTGWSRSAVRRLIDGGRVTVGDRAATKPGQTLVPGVEIHVELPDPEPDRIVGEDIPIAVLYEDDVMIAVDKPAGLAVHPGHGRSTGTLVHALAGRGTPLAPAGGALRPGIVHRLDMNTSGVLVVAKTDEAHRALSAAFADREVGKTYHALVWGKPNPPDGTVSRAIGRDRNQRVKMTTGGVGARPAVTHYRTLEHMPGFAWLEIDLETGRTHQIRVHLQSIHHPVVGDERYGGRMWRGVQDPTRRAALRRFPRQALHASKLTLAHPVSGRRMRFRSPLPADIEALLDVLRAPT